MGRYNKLVIGQNVEIFSISSHVCNFSHIDRDQRLCEEVVSFPVLNHDLRLFRNSLFDGPVLLTSNHNSVILCSQIVDIDYSIW